MELLARQIYQSPLALLRENAQNAFDAVQERLHTKQAFDPVIQIRLEPRQIVVADNGIGMTPNDLLEHYWTAGHSSKNNERARNAGVVGTFGIGAMANFGIAERLTVETESAITGERTRCRADRSTLDLQQNCIEREVLAPQGRAGTTVTADVAAGEIVNVPRATEYIRDFVSLVSAPVYVNGELVSQRPEKELVPAVPEVWRVSRSKERVSSRMQADATIVCSNNADLLVQLGEIYWDDRRLTGRLVLRSGHSVLRTFRNGFGLATSSVGSYYQYGGIADFRILEPTAGREAITVDGLQLLQGMVTAVDGFTSRILAGRQESDVSSAFMRWVIAHGRYEWCGKLRMTVVPGERMTLEDVSKEKRTQPMLAYGGGDRGVIQMHASEETPLLVLAKTNPRRTCEDGYLRRHARIEWVSDRPMVKDRRGYGRQNTAERAVAYKITSILDSDYFVDAGVEFGEISHGLPVVVEKREGGIDVVLNDRAQSVKILIGVFETEYDALGSMTKDFVRSVLFSKLAEHVPSSTRGGAETVLRAIRKRPEAFEYADDDLGSLPSIWKDYDEGQISLEQAVARSRAAVRGNVQVVDTATRAEDVVPDVLENERTFSGANGPIFDLEAWPGITRLEISTPHKMLVIAGDRPALRGYRCFLAIADKAREEMGEFFLQPHRTSIVWGGQRTLFIFMHHSGEFGLYYDLQTQELVDAPTGGQAYPTCSIVLKNRIYIPIPECISTSFVPAPGERKRFEVRADVLRTGESEEGGRRRRNLG